MCQNLTAKELININGQLHEEIGKIKEQKVFMSMMIIFSLFTYVYLCTMLTKMHCFILKV